MKIYREDSGKISESEIILNIKNKLFALLPGTVRTLEENISHH